MILLPNRDFWSPFAGQTGGRSGSGGSRFSAQEAGGGDRAAVGLVGWYLPKWLGNLINGHFRNLNWRLLEVPTIYKAYVLGLCKGISPENMPLYGTVPPF